MTAPAPILLTGKNGQIGSELEKLLPRLGKLIAIDRDELDLSDSSAVRCLVEQMRPRLIMNAAAYTAVDQAERDQHAARVLNEEVPAVLAEEAKKVNTALVHSSTDYLFDGL